MTDRTAALDIEVNAKKAKQGSAQATRSLDDIKRSARGATQATDGTSGAFGRLKQQSSVLVPALKAVVASMGVREVVNARLEYERITRTLKVVAGSTEGARREFSFVREQADRLGLALRDAASQYSRMSAAAQGTSLEGKKTQAIFASVAQASTVLGLSGEQTTGVFRALEQMISKGNVQAEELRGQLGERLPGAFQLAARAMGKTTQELNKMLDNGQVLAEDLLPKLAQELNRVFGKDVQDAAQSLQAQINRMKTAWFDFMLAVGDSGIIDVISAAIKGVSVVMNEVLTPAFKAVGEGISSIVTYFASWLDNFGPATKVLQNFGKIATATFRAIADEINEALTRLQAWRNGIEYEPANISFMDRVELHYRKIEKDSAAAAKRLEELNAALNDQSGANDAATKAAQKAKAAFDAQIASMEKELDIQRLLAAGNEAEAAFVENRIQLEQKLKRSLTEGELDVLRQKVEEQRQLNDAIDQQKKLQDQAADSAEKLFEPMKNALDEIQSSFSTMLRSVLDDGLDGFGDFTDKVKSIFKDMIAQMATVALVNPVIVPVVSSIGGMMGVNIGGVGGMTSMGGGAGGAGGGGMLGQAGSLLATGSSLGGLFGTASGGIVGSINGFGAQMGFGNLFTPGAGWSAGWTSASLGSTLGAAGLGYLGGSMLGNIGGNTTGGGIGGALGATAGMLIGGPVGAIIGGALGGTAGGFFGNSQPSNQSAGATFNPITGYRYSEGNKTSANIEGREALVDAILQAANALTDVTGGSLNSRVNVDVGSRDGIQYVVGGVSGRVGVGDAEGALTNITSLLADQLQGIPADLQRAIDNIDFSDIEQAFTDLEFAVAYTNGTLFETGESTTQAAQAIEAINAQFDELSTQAQRLGLSLGPLEDARQQQIAQLTTDFNDSILAQISAIEDPLNYQMDALLEAQEQRVKEAEALGADMVALEKLAGLERLQAMQQYTSSLQDLLDNLTMGTAGNLAPAERLSNAESLFNETVNAIQGGNTSALADLSDIASTFLDASSAYYGTSSGFIQDRDMVTQLLEQLLGDVPRYAGGGIATSASIFGEAGPEAAVPLPDGRTIPVTMDTSSIVSELRALRAEQARQSRATTEELQAMREDNKRLKNSLERVSSMAVGGRR